MIIKINYLLLFFLFGSKYKACTYTQHIYIHFHLPSSIFNLSLLHRSLPYTHPNSLTRQKPLQLPPGIHLTSPLIHSLTHHASRFTPFLTETPSHPLGPAIFARLLGELHRWEIMFVFLHGGDPGHVVECHDSESEISVVRDGGDLGEKFGEGWGGLIVDGGDEVGRCQAVLVGWRASGLVQRLGKFL